MCKANTDVLRLGDPIDRLRSYRELFTVPALTHYYDDHALTAHSSFEEPEEAW